jgi:hypothetical protein
VDTRAPFGTLESGHRRVRGVTCISKSGNNGATVTDALAVEVRGLVKRFGDRVTAVDGLDLAVRNTGGLNAGDLNADGRRQADAAGARLRIESI